MTHFSISTSHLNCIAQLLYLLRSGQDTDEGQWPHRDGLRSVRRMQPSQWAQALIIFQMSKAELDTVLNLTGASTTEVIGTPPSPNSTRSGDAT